MIFDALLKPFLDQRPVAVMTRACFEHAFAAPQIDALFDQVKQNQYHRRLLFSSLVELLSSVVTRRCSSVHAAYRADPTRLGVTLAAVYDKLNHTDLAVSEALLADTAGRLRAVVQTWPDRPQPFAGLRLKIVDGNYLAGTDHRLKVLRPHRAAALPGMAIAVQDHGTGLVTDLILSEDAYTNERAIALRLLPTFAPDEVIVADRNFFFSDFLEPLAAQGSYFVIRHHAATTLHLDGESKHMGSTKTGEVYEQTARVGLGVYRLIRVVLKSPTSDGDTEIRIVTNLPKERASAVAVAEAYRLRWTLEATFLEVTRSVQCELASLGHPKAALLTFALALCACNALRVVTRAIEITQGAAHPEEEISSYYVVKELIGAEDGMNLIVPETVWETIRHLTAADLSRWLLEVASRANWSKYRKAKRGPKKPQPKKIVSRSPHRSTHRLLNGHKK